MNTTVQRFKVRPTILSFTKKFIIPQNVRHTVGNCPHGYEGDSGGKGIESYHEKYL